MNLRKLLKALSINKEENMKKYIAMFLSCILILSQGTLIFAEENNVSEENMK